MHCDRTEYDVLQLLQAGLSGVICCRRCANALERCGQYARYTTRMTCCAHFPVSVCSGGAYRLTLHAVASCTHSASVEITVDLSCVD